MSCLEIERRPPVRRVRLDAGPRNVLTLDAVAALHDALAPDHEAPVVVLSGREDAFCSGLDNATLAASADRREALLAAMGELLLAALAGPTRVVVACAGHAVAAGAMLLLVADVRIGARGDYKIGFTEPRLGLPLPELPGLLARERLDRRRLHDLTVGGRTVGPEGALDAGFFDAVVEPEALEGEAEARAGELAGLGDAAYRGTLASVYGTAIERLRVLVGEQGRRRDAARALAD